MQTTKNRIPVIAAFVTLCLLTPLSAAPFAGETGEPNDPYQIATAEQLVSIGSDPNLADKHFVLIADIDLDPNLPGGKVFDQAVIASGHAMNGSEGTLVGAAFTGVFDGDGHTISNLTIRGTGDLGLFGLVSGVVRNVAIADADVVGSDSRVGLLAGAVEGTVTQCHSDGTATGGGWVGGLVGQLAEGRIVRCYSDAKVSAAGDYAGGLVGGNGAGNVVLAHATGPVSGRQRVGGLAGCLVDGAVSLSYSTGAVSGSGEIGGLVGSNEGGCLTHCYSVGAVGGESGSGGLVGASRRTRTQAADIGCFWDIDSSGQSASKAGTGLTTAQMQNASTFLAAGWDFVDETANGVSDIWQIAAGEYPQLRCCGIDGPTMPEGLGTDEQPYLVQDANDLGTVWFEPEASYRLTASIDLSGTGWSVPVIPWFDGTLDGNGCVIRNLHIRGGWRLGLVGETGPGAGIANLALEAVDVNGTGSYIGGLVGRNQGDIAASSSTGAVAGVYYIGGLLGDNAGRVVDSSAEGEISGRGSVGGLAGRSWGVVDSCHGAGRIVGNGQVGGLVGRNEGDIVESHSEADVCSTNGEATDSDFGGLVGRHSGWVIERLGGVVEVRVGSISGSSATGTVSGGSSVGGLVGTSSGATVETSHSAAAVDGRQLVGGLVGYNSGDVATSYASGPVSGDRRVGGLAGLNDGSIVDSYSTGAISGNEDVGGLVGCNVDLVIGGYVLKGKIATCYSVGTVIGSTAIGGLVGAGRTDYVTACFWDTETSGQSTSLAGEGRTTAEMQTAGTFLDAGWDFADETANGEEDTWWIVEGQDYPRLWWEAEVADATAGD